MNTFTTKDSKCARTCRLASSPLQGMIAAAVIACSFAAGYAQAAPAEPVKNIVLVHGAFADGSSWAKVIKILQAKGYNVTAVQIPLTSFADDVAEGLEPALLRLQPARCKNLRGSARIVLAAGNDVWHAGVIFLHQGVLRNGSHRRLKRIDVPTLILHGDDDQIVPIADSALLSAKIVKNVKLQVYKGAPHGMCTTHKEQVNEDLIGFIEA